MFYMGDKIGLLFWCVESKDRQFYTTSLVSPVRILDRLYANMLIPLKTGSWEILPNSCSQYNDNERQKKYHIQQSEWVICDQHSSPSNNGQIFYNEHLNDLYVYIYILPYIYDHIYIYIICIYKKEKLTHI